MIQNRFAYCRKTMKPLYSHESLTLLTDLLHIEQQEEFSIVNLDNDDLFKKHTADELFKLYVNLGGDRAQLPQAADRYTKFEEIRRSCVEMAIALPSVVINGFNAELQATWIDKQKEAGKDVKGYTYKKGSDIPEKRLP